MVVVLSPVAGVMPVIAGAAAAAGIKSNTNISIAIPNEGVIRDGEKRSEPGKFRL
jgi:hypothetical protein